MVSQIGLDTAPGLSGVWTTAQTETYYADAGTLTGIIFLLFHFVELRRWADIKNPGSVSQVRSSCEVLSRYL